MTGALSVTNLEVRYGDLVGVADVSLEVRQGSVVALLGSNGAGKTTTLNAIAGLVSASAGAIEWSGERIERVGAARIVRKGLTLSPEGWRLFANRPWSRTYGWGRWPSPTARASPISSTGSTRSSPAWRSARSSAPGR